MSFELPPLTISIEDDAPARDLQSIHNGLSSFNLSFNADYWADHAYINLGVFLRDERGALRGGLTAGLGVGALEIEQLWVEPALRRRGLGTLLLAAAEARAWVTGNLLLWTEVMSFQSPAFFAQAGYTEYAYLDGYMGGAARSYLCRSLAAANARRPNPGVLAALKLHLEVVDNAGAEDAQSVREGVSDASAQMGRQDAAAPLHVLVRGPDGQVLGGLTASTRWDVCFVDILWLDIALRRKGIGSALMAVAEAEAARRKCTMIHLDTFSFQARGFYEKLGFTVFGTLRGLADEVERYHMVKRIT